jgi:hypothetical protein
MVERLAERHGARVQSADGTAEGDGPEAVLMRRIVDAFAEYERLVIRARTRAALAVKRSRGERTGGIPYGYQLSTDRVHLEPCRTEQLVLRLVRRYHTQGLALRRIGARLQMRGLTPRSGACWHPQTIASIVCRSHAHFVVNAPPRSISEAFTRRLQPALFSGVDRRTQGRVDASGRFVLHVG